MPSLGALTLDNLTFEFITNLKILNKLKRMSIRIYLHFMTISYLAVKKTLLRQ